MYMHDRNRNLGGLLRTLHLQKEVRATGTPEGGLRSNIFVSDGLGLIAMTN